ncbi:helix-turn-helix domain-containing protein [Acinetobacter courvalinii]|uniref:helix-turn-helix domain-containing protein n=1 Tax=Acinetobacter courvalinii TaxID=280147 RepID=UPI0028A25A26|nr:helix-turn-helix transcriptional regulator [Acinetobacter courvalinii]
MKHPLDNQTVDWVGRPVPSLTQVRQALKLLAERKGRPDYELCTAKEVKCALKHGLEHHLIPELPFIELEPREEDKALNLYGTRKYPDPKERKEMEDWIKGYPGMLAELASKAGCSASNLSHIKNGRINCTMDMYIKLKKVRESMGEAA